MKPDINSLIIYEDTQIIVCHKPAGIAVQSARLGEKDLESLLKNHIAASQARPAHGSGSVSAPYLAVIHRLDQPVEGLLVFAKTQKAARELNRQLTTSGFGKHYRALVAGIPVPSEGTLEDYLVKDARSNTSRVCSKDTPGAKLARLHYKTLETYPADNASPLSSGSPLQEPVTSLVEVTLDTGRHHQIRVQMSHLGCPLAGDRKYGYTGTQNKAHDRAGTPEDAEHSDFVPHRRNRKNAEPLKLCAYKLCFKHPSDGRELTFELP